MSNLMRAERYLTLIFRPHTQMQKLAWGLSLIDWPHNCEIHHYNLLAMKVQMKKYTGPPMIQPVEPSKFIRLASRQLLPAPGLHKSRQMDELDWSRNYTTCLMIPQSTLNPGKNSSIKARHLTCHSSYIGCKRCIRKSSI